MDARTWKQLVVIHNAAGYGESVVKEFWWDAFAILRNAKMLDAFPTLDGEASFHVRFSGNTDARGRYLELFRLRTTDWDSELATAIKASIQRSDVSSVSWNAWDSDGRSNRFLTFLQACSVLRVQHGVSHARFLAGNSPCEVAEAYQEMRAPDRPWSRYLRPWFEHLDTMRGRAEYERDDVNEYAHWFGHILSDRALDA